MCVWIHGKTLVRLAVAELDPKQAYIKLTNQSEVIVAPKVRKPTATNPAEDISELSAANVPKKLQPSIGLRTCSISHEAVDPLAVYIHPDSLEPFHTDIPERVRLTKLVPTFMSTNNKNKREEDQVELEESVDAKALFANLIVSNAVPLKHVVVGSVLKSTLDIEDFDIVK
jgi:peroxin-1